MSNNNTVAPKLNREGLLPNLRRKVLSSQSFYLILIIIALTIVTQSVNPLFLSSANLRSVLGQISTLGLLSCGMLVVIISGNFDISVGSIIGLSATVMCLSIKAGTPELLAALIGIGVAMACSTLNGVLSVLFKAPAFIITLATTSVFTGISLIITNGKNVPVYEAFYSLTSTYILDIIPLIFVISILGYVFIGLLLKYTQFGRRVFGIGCNEQAAYLAGINVKLNKVLCFAVNGFMIGLAVIVYIARLGAAQPSTGSGMELDAIGACIIGGAAINGGRGDVVGTFFGVFLTNIIFNALNMMQVSSYVQDISFGVLILISIGIGSIRTVISNK